MNIDNVFLEFWNGLGPKPPTTLRFFERGEIFTLHDADALLVAKEYFQNTSMINYCRKGEKGLPYISVKKSNMDIFRHFLLKQQYRVEIYSGSTKFGRDNDWTLKIRASPGNIAQLEDLFALSAVTTEVTGLSSISLSLQNDQLFVSVGFCDKDGRRFIAGEFVDSVHLANLETAIVQLESRECLVPNGLLNGSAKDAGFKLKDPTIIEHLKMIFDRSGVLVTEVDKADFALSDVSQDLNYLLRRSNVGSYKIPGHQPGLNCLGAIIKYLDLKADDSSAAAFSLQTFSLDNFVRLDSAATRALHLLPGPDDKNRYQSVFGVLNNCRTQQGQRLLAQWLRQPLTDVRQIDERLDLVESLIEESGVRQSLYEDFLRRLPDFQRLTRKLQKRQGAGLQDVFRIYQAITRIPNAIELLQQCSGTHAHAVENCLITPLREAVDNFAKYQEMVESTIDLDAIQRRNEFLVRADFDDALGDLRNKLMELEESIEEEFRRSARRLNLDPGKSVKLDSNDQLGYFMRVTLKEEKILREFKTFEILDAQKGGVRFRNAAMSRLNDSYMETKQEYVNVQQSIVDEVLRIAAGYFDPLHGLNQTTAELDVIVSLAIAAVSAPGGQYVRPKLIPREGGRIVLSQLRHPCLEMQENVSVIANDVYLERGKQIFLIITGPNMGGKSTYIRGVGVVVAMAQIGSFVPCDAAELFPVDAIMARVGATDCQIRGVSTFLAEMLETSSVLRAATANSLVIIDELGRGTSTYDGFGLAWAVASHLAGPQLGCFSLFATHFHELTSLAHHMPGRVANLRVSAHVSDQCDDGKSDSHGVVMLYTVEPGVCNRSYGLEVARLAGLPEEVIKEAEIKARRDEQIESLWLKLDEENELSDKGANQAKRMCLETPQMNSSNAVVVADRLRGVLVDVLQRSVSGLLPNQSKNFGVELTNLVKSALRTNANEIPVELLFGLTS